MATERVTTKDKKRHGQTGSEKGEVINRSNNAQKSLYIKRCDVPFEKLKRVIVFSIFLCLQLPSHGGLITGSSADSFMGFWETNEFLFPRALMQR